MTASNGSMGRTNKDDSMSHAVRITRDQPELHCHSNSIFVLGQETIMPRLCIHTYVELLVLLGLLFRPLDNQDRAFAVLRTVIAYAAQERPAIFLHTRKYVPKWP